MRYTNEDCELIRISGKLEGLNGYLTFIKEYSKSPDYRGDLSDEIKRVETEINELKTEEDDIRRTR
jgi:hypothetical protein